MGRMNKSLLVDDLIALLRKAMPEFNEVLRPRSPLYSDRRAYLRGLMNVYKSERKLPKEFFLEEDELLTMEKKENKLSQFLIFWLSNPKLLCGKGILPV